MHGFCAERHSIQEIRILLMVLHFRDWQGEKLNLGGWERGGLAELWGGCPAFDSFYAAPH